MKIKGLTMAQLQAQCLQDRAETLKTMARVQAWHDRSIAALEAQEAELEELVKEALG